MAYFIPVPTNMATVPDIASTYGVPMAFIAGYEIAITGATTFTVQPGNANAENNGSTIQYPSVLPTLPGVITVDVTQLAGPGLTLGNQIQPGTSGVYPVSLASLGLANDTMFPVYIVGDSSGLNNPIVVVATGNNFVPDVAAPQRSYDSFRRIGWVYVDNSTLNLIPFIQSGSFTDRDYMFANPISVLESGVATSPTLVDLSINDGPIVPGPTSKVLLSVIFTPDSQADVATLTPTGLTGNLLVYQGATAAAKVSWPSEEIIPGVDPTTGHSGVDYSVSAGTDGLTLEVVGFTDTLRLRVV